MNSEQLQLPDFELTLQNPSLFFSRELNAQPESPISLRGKRAIGRSPLRIYFGSSRVLQDAYFATLNMAPPDFPSSFHFTLTFGHTQHGPKPRLHSCETTSG